MAAEKAPADAGYEIGYGKPPIGTRFRPGRSGNPNGRKKGTKSVSSQLSKILQRMVAVTENGREKKMPLQEVMLNSIANKAAKGDLKSAQFLLNIQDKYRDSDAQTIEQSDLMPDDLQIIADFVSRLSDQGACNASASADDPEDQE